MGVPPDAIALIAGNRTAGSWTVRVDTTHAAIAPTATPVSFSPNADGVSDATRLGWTSSERITGIARIPCAAQP